MRAIRVQVVAEGHIIFSALTMDVHEEHFAAMFRDALDRAARSRLRALGAGQGGPGSWVRATVEVQYSEVEIP